MLLAAGGVRLDWLSIITGCRGRPEGCREGGIGRGRGAGHRSFFEGEIGVDVDVGRARGLWTSHRAMTVDSTPPRTKAMAAVWRRT